MTTRRHAKGSHRSDGFTIVESVIALMIITILVLSMVQVFSSALKGERRARQHQQAAEVGTQAMERLRNISFNDLTMVASELVDPEIQTTCPPYTATDKRWFDPDGWGVGTLVCEPIAATSAGGKVSPLATQEIVGNVRFTVKRFITWIDATTQGGTDQSLKRATVVVQWTSDGVSSTYRTSTSISRAIRGLPVPKFRVSALAPTADPLAFAFVIEDQGITDAYTLAVSVKGAAVAGQFRIDLPVVGTFDLGDPLITDTNEAGEITTGNFATGESRNLLVVVPSAEVGSTVEVVVTSGAVPGASKSVTYTVPSPTTGVT